MAYYDTQRLATDDAIRVGPLHWLGLGLGLGLALNLTQTLARWACSTACAMAGR